MALTSFPFILFFVVVYLFNGIYVTVSRRCNIENIKAYKLVLLIESYAFLIISDIKTVICLFILTIICYGVAYGIKKSQTYAKIFLAVGIIFSIGQLCIFKYYNFIYDAICTVLQYEYEMPIPFTILGISFFTFSAISYLIDTYTKKADGNFLEIALYLAFFPKFLSGPIVRLSDFQKELNQGAQNISVENLQIGIQYVVWGLFKKMVLADHLAIFVDDVYLSPSIFSSATCLWAILSYSLQIYFDFSGYSDMAIGFSRMLGIKLNKNFDLPYLSKNVTEFWKRWHISLSTWLRDYLYISLGGNRKGKFRTQINLMITMILGGLWHGASITFIVWGAIHGVTLVIHKQYKTFVQKTQTKASYFLSVIGTFIYISITWVFFRAEDLQTAFDILFQAISFENGISQIFSWTWLAIIFAVCEIMFSRKKCKDDSIISIKYPILKLDAICNLMLFFILIGLTIILAYVGNTAFIYGKF